MAWKLLQVKVNKLIGDIIFMKVACQIAALSLNAVTLQIKANICTSIFYCIPKLLLSRVGDWAAGKLNESDEALFLSC